LEKSFIENGGEYRKCLASSLFEVKGNPQLDKDSFNFSKDSKYPYFTRTVFNNGILGYVDYLDKEHLIKGNSLAVGMMGMRFFYMEHDFYAGQFTKTAFPLFEGFNESVALWFISWFNKSSAKYLGLLVRDFENAFNNTELIVPYQNGKVAVDYIESRIRELEESRIRELEAYLIAAGFEDCALTQSERDAIDKFKNGTFGYVCIGDLYDKVKLNNKKFNKRYDAAKERSKTFSVPLVNAKHGDNGIMFYGRNEVFDTVSSSIAIIQNGVVATGDVYPQPEATSVLWDAYLIKSPSDSDTENSLFYITAAIEKTIKLKYNYDKKATWERVKTENIYLPLTDQGNIDYVFIENYINAIKKQCIAALKQEIAREHQAYEQAVGVSATEPESTQEKTNIIVLPQYREGCVPLYTLRAACGYFEGGEVPEEEGWVEASGNEFTPDPKRYFAVHAKGNSMLPKIQDGDICVFEWYKAGSRDGEIVLTQTNAIDAEYGAEYTIKQYRSEKTQTEEGWQHTKIELQPLNKDYDVIELDSETEYRTVGVLKCVLKQRNTKYDITN